MINKNTNYILVAVVVVILVLLVVWMAGGSKKIEAPTEEVVETPAVKEIKNPLIGEKVTSGGAAARVYLATRLNLPVQEVKIVKEATKEWPDSCLGIASPGTSCAQVITSGYEVTLEAKGVTYMYRTNLTGSVVKAAN